MVISILCHRMRKLRDSGRNLYMNDHLCSGRPVSTIDNGNRQKWGYFLSIGLTRVSEIIAGLGYKEVCAV